MKATIIFLIWGLSALLKSYQHYDEGEDEEGGRQGKPYFAQ